MKPLKNNVLVVDAGENTKTTPMGIILTEDFNKGSSKPGIVVAVGPDVENVNVGDKIALEWNSGLPITIKGEKAILIKEVFVMGVY